ncbi:hypothetical protein AFEL58S_01588 [Afipia felis]
MDWGRQRPPGNHFFTKLLGPAEQGANDKTARLDIVKEFRFHGT